MQDLDVIDAEALHTLIKELEAGKAAAAAAVDAIELKEADV